MSSTCVISAPYVKSELSSPEDSDFLSQHPALRGQLKTSEIENIYTHNNEVMRGQLTLLGSPHGAQRVILSVTRTSVDHFALVYSDNRRKMIGKPVGCINLRGVSCEETVLGNGIIGFTLRPKKCDTSLSTLIFVCQEKEDLGKWIEALSPLSLNNQNKRNIPRQLSLPCLEEEEE